MIGGRLNGSTLACRICEAAPKVRPISACAESAAALRSANGLSRATMKALFGSDAPSSSEKADDRERVLDGRHLLQQVFNLLR